MSSTTCGRSKTGCRKTTPEAVGAFAGSLGETIAFYAVLLVRDVRARRRSDPQRPAVYVTVRGLLVEFGPAEVADTLVVRPFAMYVGPMIVADAAMGVALGKFAADLVFYTLAIIGYELRRGRFRHERLHHAEPPAERSSRPVRRAGPAEPALGPLRGVRLGRPVRTRPARPHWRPGRAHVRPVDRRDVS
ncbi:hypothetical protein OHA25_43660 [Nonomuraea sp. NBC_00507]|uniref:hypothetical protein n=1 Tax=Nonomuraea sp. NBC_00507 TaxID=2976002 RepID=UPI002E18D9F4